MAEFMDSPYGKILNRFYTKNGELPDSWQPFLMVKNMSMSHNPAIKKAAQKINEYTFTFYNEKWLMEALIDVSIPKMDRMPFVKLTKKTKKVTDKYLPILKMYQKRYSWTEKELTINTPIIIKELNNDTKIIEVLNFMGADKKLFKKFGFTVEKPKTKEVKMKSVFSF